MFNGFQYWFIKQIKDKAVTKETDIVVGLNQDPKSNLWLLKHSNVVSPNQVSLRETIEPATSIVRKQQLSNIMNNAAVWYLTSNLPSVYLKNLASDSGSIVEKICNAVLVSCPLESNARQRYSISTINTIHIISRRTDGSFCTRVRLMVSASTDSWAVCSITKLQRSCSSCANLVSLWLDVKIKFPLPVSSANASLAYR